MARTMDSGSRKATVSRLAAARAPTRPKVNAARQRKLTAVSSRNGSRVTTGASGPRRQDSSTIWLSSGRRSSRLGTTLPPSTPAKKLPTLGPPILASAVMASSAVGPSSAGRPVIRSISGCAPAVSLIRPMANAAATRTVESGSESSGTRIGVARGSPILPAAIAASRRTTESGATSALRKRAG
jgi:hypothetical protein